MIVPPPSPSVRAAKISNHDGSDVKVVESNSGECAQRAGPLVSLLEHALVAKKNRLKRPKRFVFGLRVAIDANGPST
jgi:hypothetical protein